MEMRCLLDEEGGDVLTCWYIGIALEYGVLVRVEG